MYNDNKVFYSILLCVRYGVGCVEQYKENLHKFFGQIKTIVRHDCLILWNLAMPLGKKIKGGFLVPEVSTCQLWACRFSFQTNRN